MSLRPLQLAQTSSHYMWLLLLFIMFPSTLWSMHNNSTTLLEWVIIPISSTPILLTLICDPMGLLFSSTVLLISANVLKFSSTYMSEDKFITRFTILVILFILSMNLLIFIPHLMILLLGWDGLGITSFILVVYYQNPKSLAAGMITALTNRIGDVMLLLSIAWALNQGHWNILHMWQSNFSAFQVTAITIAGMTKSAQMPFSSWLPAAMAAPTPVSALVHSSTLVTAGVFLLIRFFPFLNSNQWFSPILLFIAVSTMLMAGISACTECDMKKIIALSTLSQLGMMMTSLGLGLMQMAFFHLITHAMFKALLFICAGTLISTHNHSQDLRWMGNLMHQAPISSSCFLVANLALCGFPFMAGFYSKDMILETALFSSYNTLMVSISMFTVGLTSMYSARLSVVSVWSPCLHCPLNNLSEPLSSIFPMMTMSVASIIAGASIQWSMPFISPLNILPESLKFMTLITIALGFILGYFISSMNLTAPVKSLYFYLNSFASCQMWFLVPLSSQFILPMPLMSAHHYLKSLDQSWLELSGPTGINLSIISMSNSIMSLNPKTATSFLTMSALSSLLIMYMILKL